VLLNTQSNTHTVRVRYSAVTGVAPSCGRRLGYEYADCCKSAFFDVRIMYDLSVLGKERKKSAFGTWNLATDGEEMWVLMSSVKAVEVKAKLSRYWPEQALGDPVG
jgi:hypothetical protein